MLSRSVIAPVSQIKTVIIGESSIGKSSIFRRLAGEDFRENEESTIGTDIKVKTIKYTDYNTSLQLEIWDTAGSEQYKQLTNIFYQNASIAILVYDITNEHTFDELKNFWYHDVITKVPGIIIGVAGNKADLYAFEKVEESKARNFAENINATFKLTSAKTGSGIDDMLYELGLRFLKANKDNPNYNLRKAFTLESYHGEQKIEKKKDCCR